MSQGFHKIHSGKKIKHTHSLFCHSFDKCMYVIGLIAPIMTVPQLWDIWTKHSVKGVSLATWAAYAGVSFLWAVYGIMHKDKVILFANVPLCILDSAIVVGILMYR